MADTLLGISELVLQKLLNVSTVPGMVFRAGQQLEGKKSQDSVPTEVTVKLGYVHVRYLMNSLYNCKLW